MHDQTLNPTNGAEVTVGFCLCCGKPVMADPSAGLPIFLEDVPEELVSCKKCRRRVVTYLRTPRMARYQCANMSTSCELSGAYSLSDKDVHQYLTAELCELARTGSWNGFMEVHDFAEVPSLCEVSVPESHNRKMAESDIITYIASLVASGVIGGVAYDLVKSAVKRLHQLLQGPNRGKPTDGEDADAIAESLSRRLHDYVASRLRGIDDIAAPDGVVYRGARFLAKHPVTTLAAASRALRCTPKVAKVTLQTLGASFDEGTGNWSLPSLLVNYYRGRHGVAAPAQQKHEGDFYASGPRGSEASTELCLPIPDGLSDDEEMDLECSIIPAVTKDLESFMRGEICEGEFHARVMAEAYRQGRALMQKKGIAKPRFHTSGISLHTHPSGP